MNLQRDAIRYRCKELSAAELDMTIGYAMLQSFIDQHGDNPEFHNVVVAIKAFLGDD